MNKGQSLLALLFILFALLSFSRNQVVVAQQSAAIPSSNQKSITIIGAVNLPMRIELKRSQIHLTEVLALAGGVTERAKGIVQVVRNSEPQVLSGRGEMTGTANYKLDDLLNRDNQSNPNIYPGDEVFVPEVDSIFVLGRILKPGAYLKKEPITVTQAIRIAGGVLPDATHINVILCSQSSNDLNPKVISFDLKNLNSRRPKEVYLEGNDIVFVQSRFPMIITGLLSCPQTRNRNVQLPLRVVN